jgi:hypothetical protein
VGPEAEAFPEVDPAHFRVRQHRALVEDVGAVADAEGFADVVVGDQDADAAVLEVLDDALDLADRNRVDAGEGFVEQHQLRPGRERARDLDPASFAAGEAGADLVGDVFDLQFVHQSGEFALAPGAVEVRAQFQHQAQVVGDAELAEHRGFLRQVADAELGALVHRLGGDVAAVQFDAPGVRGH